MRILQKGGVLGEENQDWRNVSEHCVTEAVGAEVLAKGLGADAQKVVAAALIHDWFKRREIEAMNKEGAGKGHRMTLEEDKTLLQSFGVSEDIIAIAHANIPAQAEPEYLDNRTMEEKIMHYMDTITSNTNYVPYQERFKLLVEKPRNVEFSDSYKAQFDGKSLYEVQAEVADREEKEFAEKLGIDQEKLIDYILNSLQTQIERGS